MPGAVSRSQSSLNPISTPSMPEPGFGLRKGQIYTTSSGRSGFAHFTFNLASDTQIKDTQLLLVPSNLGHLRLLQPPTPGLAFSHRQGEPENVCVCTAAGFIESGHVEYPVASEDLHRM